MALGLAKILFSLTFDGHSTCNLLTYVASPYAKKYFLLVIRINNMVNYIALNLTLSITQVKFNGATLFAVTKFRVTHFDSDQCFPKELR